MNQFREMPVLLLIVFLGMLGYGLMVPLVPLYALKLGVSETFITWIIASYALSQFAGAPLWGRLSDRFGRKSVLMATVGIAVIGYVVLAMANSVWMLLLARMIGGFSAGNLSTAYAYVSDRTEPENRTSAIGKVSAAFGAGFMVGPAIGGLLAGGADIETANFARPALVAATMSLVALLGTYFFLPESRARQNTSGKKPAKQAGLLATNLALLRRPVLLALLLTTALIFTTTSVRESVLALWAQARLDLTPGQLGLLFSYNGVVLTFAQVFVVGRIASRWGDYTMLCIGLACCVFGLVGYVFASTIPVLIISATLNSFGTGAFATGLPTLFTKQAGENERGAVMGIYQSVGSFSRFLGPTFSGALYERVSITAPFIFGVVSMSIAFGLAILAGLVARAKGTISPDDAAERAADRSDDLPAPPAS